MCVWCATLCPCALRSVNRTHVADSTIDRQQLHTCRVHRWGAVQSLVLLPLQVSDTVEAALREADIDHDGSIGLAGEHDVVTSTVQDTNMTKHAIIVHSPRWL